MPAELWLCLFTLIYIMALIEADRRCRLPLKAMRHMRSAAHMRKQRKGLRKQIDSLKWLKGGYNLPEPAAA